MNDFEYKKYYRPASCSSPPWAIFIPVQDRPEILRQIRQECLDIYGKTFDECDKRLTCYKKTCMGRQLPWKSKTAKPFLDKLALVQKFKMNESSKELELVLDLGCQSCPIFKTCKQPCNQVLDFIERNKAQEPIIDYKKIDDNLISKKEIFESSEFKLSAQDIPWDVISAKKAEIIRKYLFEGRDYRYIAEKLDLTNQARVKYEMYSAINKLAKYAAVRKFLDKHFDELTEKQLEIFNLVYRKNLSYVQVSKLLNISKQSVQQTVCRVLKKYKVKWKTYVKKSYKKVKYNVPEIFKT